MEHSRNLGESVAVLLAVPGTRLVELLVTGKRSTTGLRVSPLANVSAGSGCTCMRSVKLGCWSHSVFSLPTLPLFRADTRGNDTANKSSLPHVRHHAEIRQTQLLRPWRLLVRDVRELREHRLSPHLVRRHSELSGTAVASSHGPTDARFVDT